MKLKVLDIDVLLIKVSITDGRRLILHYIDILPFFTVVILKTILNGGYDPRYRVLTSGFLIRGSNKQYYNTPGGSLGECMVTPLAYCHGISITYGLRKFHRWWWEGVFLLLCFWSSTCLYRAKGFLMGSIPVFIS